MIDKTGAKCDRCPAREDVYGLDFQGIVNTIKRAGWLIKKVGNIWMHYCPTCREKIQPSTAQRDNPPPPASARWYDDK